MRGNKLSSSVHVHMYKVPKYRCRYADSWPQSKTDEELKMSCRRLRVQARTISKQRAEAAWRGQQDRECNGHGARTSLGSALEFSSPRCDTLSMDCSRSRTPEILSVLVTISAITSPRRGWAGASRDDTTISKSAARRMSKAI